MNDVLSRARWRPWTLWILVALATGPIVNAQDAAAGDSPAAKPAAEAGAGPDTAAPQPNAAEPAKDDAAKTGAAEEDKGPLVALAETVDEQAGGIVKRMEAVLFWDPVKAIVGAEKTKEWGLPAIPLVVLWLIFGAVFFTIRMRFINIGGFIHAINVVRGKYDNPNDTGEVSHFQALSAALSATVGLGNIAGVAVAVAVGGPGAVFWMVVSALFSMTSKFVECTLGQKYRQVDSAGNVSGGPMRYLYRGLSDLGLFGIGRPLGGFLAVVFAILCVGGSLGGGNMFQANQSWEAIRSAVDPDKVNDWVGTYGPIIYGFTLATLVGLVILGGMRRIAATAGRIVPLMCGLYVASALIILGMNFDRIDDAIGLIFRQAFGNEAVVGGFLGVLIRGVRRAAFSNEAGVGSAAIAHSAAKTEEPVREGLVALLEPFIDTVVVCSMTGLVLVVTGAYEPYVGAAKPAGAQITSEAFSSAGAVFPWILAVATVFFAYSTMISWSYYGERCFTWIFGARSAVLYKIIFLAFVWIGAVIKLGNVIDFSDMMILGMAFPNLLGCLLLSGVVRRDLQTYWRKLKTGQFQQFK